MKQIVILVLCLGLLGCQNIEQAHPVKRRVHPHRRSLSYHIYHVRKGDTLFAIASAHHVDLHTLIRINHFHPPYYLHKGQRLRIPRYHKVQSKRGYPKKHIKHSAYQHTHGKPSALEVTSTDKRVPLRWCMPIIGHASSAKAPYHGLWIRHKVGGRVKASAAGKVVYAGSGMPGYGQLILIEHPGRYISAYGFNHKLWVHEGQMVREGDVIAHSGINLDGAPGLYFELRRRGVPFHARRLKRRLHGCHQ